MYILGLLPKTVIGNQFIILSTDRYTRGTLTVPSLNTTSRHSVPFFSHYLILRFGTSTSFFITDSGPQLVRNLFETLCTFIGVKKLTISTYHAETTDQAERYNKTIVTRLFPYVAENKRDCAQFKQPLTYTYSSHVNCTTRTASLRLVPSCHPPHLTHLSHRLPCRLTTNPKYDKNAPLPTLISSIRNSSQRWRVN